MQVLIPFAKIKDAVPARFEAMHKYLEQIDYSGPDGFIKLTYGIPYRSELGVEGFTYDYDDVEQFFKRVVVQNHWIPDRENPLWWEHERQFTIFANPYKRIESQTVIVTLKKKIEL